MDEIEQQKRETGAPKGGPASGESAAAAADGKAAKVRKKQKKEGELLLKGVRKFVRYNRDLIKPENLDKIAAYETQFRNALNDPATEEKALDALARDLTRTCELSVPDYKPSALRENIEVVFVAIVIAMAIRAYFVQPFKIPTGSMQPTLNGIIAFPHADINQYGGVDYEQPGALGQRLAWLRGKRYINVVAPADDRITSIQEHTRFKFFTFTQVAFANSGAITIPGAKAKVDELGLKRYAKGDAVRAGELMAKGYIQTGDQVLVDKFTYHWLRPQRGDVFVFTTKGITGISSPAQFGSEHYIKRLAGVPGDHVQVDPPRLLIDGEVAQEPGFRRVMSQENGYRGYSSNGSILDKELGPREYFALGDNSNNSADSRTWGAVPEENIVGRAVMVYFPFAEHWGKID